VRCAEEQNHANKGKDGALLFLHLLSRNYVMDPHGDDAKRERESDDGMPQPGS
jgi:hypothetical protein